ncbi:unnamed protein product, partial [Staurois parvus]
MAELWRWRQAAAIGRSRTGTHDTLWTSRAAAMRMVQGPMTDYGLAAAWESVQWTHDTLWTWQQQRGGGTGA